MASTRKVTRVRTKGPRFDSNAQYIPVRYREAGVRFLLRSSTYDERGHLLVAKSFDELKRLAAEIIQRAGGYVEFTDALRVELVTPPASLQIKVAKAKYARAADTFWHAVANNLDVKKLPQGVPVVRCPKYIPTDKTYMVEEHHSLCRNCHGDMKVLSKGFTRKSFYDMFAGPVYEALQQAALPYDRRYYHDKPVAPVPEARRSQARLAGDDEELHFVSFRSFGHHGSGLTLEKVNTTWLGEFVQADEVGFFYVVQRSFKKLLDDLTADAAAAQRLSEIQREREEQRRIDERAADDRLRHNTVVAALRKAQRR